MHLEVVIRWKKTFFDVFHRCSNAMPILEPEDNMKQEDRYKSDYHQN
jgi:hypothetical protein